MNYTTALGGIVALGLSFAPIMTAMAIGDDESPCVATGPVAFVNGELVYGDMTYGTDGPDRMVGTDGCENIDGKGGNDVIHGGAGRDWLAGGEGRDTIRGGSQDDSIYGGSGNDRLFGGRGDDYLEGGDDNDLINGNTGDDGLWGGDGQDTLDGDRGDDLLVGEQGDDRLRGGPGEDRFLFDRAHGRDTILDFEDGVDLIQLTGLLDSDRYFINSFDDLEPDRQDVETDDDGRVRLPTIAPYILYNENGKQESGIALNLEEYGGGRIYIRDLAYEDLDASDFLFD